ncbi:uncharacterized protein LOC141690028 [Apium graveolens]|uniref:uncharacterized protein LOC141690028 n=1 Tax=Apium graveolens TaxID=4045 RepID=UPI003D7B3158
MLKWAIELGQFNLEYKPRSAIKGHVLEDFILETPLEGFDGKKALVAIEPTNEECLDKEEILEPWWTLHIDGAINRDGAGARVVLESPEGHQLMSAIHFSWKATNNDIEYEALISGLKLALEMNIANLIVRSDFMLVVHQVNEGFQARGSQIEMYLRNSQSLIRKFREVRVNQILRGENSNADALEKWGS